MECKCKNGMFWIGLGLGTVLGMVAYHCAKSDKVNEWKQRVSCAALSAAEKAGEWMTNAKECATKKMDADPS